MAKNNTNGISSIFKSAIKNKNRKYLLMFFSLILVICLLLITITSLFSIKAAEKIDRDGKMETFQAYLDSYTRTLESVIEKCSTNLFYEATSSMPFLSVVNERENLWYFANALINRVLLDLNSMTQRNFIFSESFFYIPRLNDVYTSTGQNSELPACSQEVQNIINTYYSIRSEEGYGLFKSGNSFIVYEDAYMYNNSPRAIIFLKINIDALSDYLNTVYSSTLDGVQLNVYYKDELLWRTPENTLLEDGNYEYIESYSQRLGWSFTLVIQETTLNTLSVMPKLLAFNIVLVVLFAFISLIAAIIMFKPFYSITDAIDKTGIISEGDKSYATAIETFSSRQKELDTAMEVVADDVLKNLFLDLLHGHPKNSNTVQNLLVGIKSNFTSLALYSTICIKYQNINEEQLIKMEESIIAYLKKADVFNDTTSMLIRYEENISVIVLQFNKENASIVDSKSRINSLMTEVMSILQKHEIKGTTNYGFLCHSILDINMSLKNALSEEEENTTKSNISISERVSLVRQAIEDCNIEDYDSTLSRIEEIIKNTDDIITLKDHLSLVLDTIGKAINVDTTVLDSFISQINTLQDKSAIIEKFTSAENSLTVMFKKQVEKMQNPYLIKARKYIDENFGSYNLSLTSIADAIGITPSYLSKLFGENMKIKLVDYICQTRVRYSMNMLINSKKSILEIASECGFSSSRNYISAFRKVYNTTPGEYRKARKLI